MPLVLLTGATRGIGHAAAVQLAQRGAGLALVGRVLAKDTRVGGYERRQRRGLASTEVGEREVDAPLQQPARVGLGLTVTHEHEHRATLPGGDDHCGHSLPIVLPCSGGSRS